MLRSLRIAIIILLFTASAANAAFDGLGQLVSSPTFAEAVALYKNGKYDPAALLLDDLGRNMRGISPEVSGLLFVMATRSAENAGNARAYESWGMATARFARSGMSWKQVRSTLDQQLEMARLGASGSAAVGAGQSPGFAGPAASLPPEAGRIATAWNLFGLKHYEQPAPGLRREMTADQIWNDLEDGAQAPVTVIPYSEGVWGQAQSSGKLNEQNITPNRTPQQKNSATPAPSVPNDHSAAAAAASYAASTQKDKPAINEQYMRSARIAWKYFQRNYQPATGLYNGLDLYPITTVWEIGTSLAALNAAHHLEILTDAEFKQRAGLMLQTVSSMDLYNNELPNKLYFADSARMVGEDQKPTSTGIGWNGTDIARLLLWLKKTAERQPEFKAATDKIFQRLRTERLVKDGNITSLSVYLNKEQLQKELGFGMPSYAAEIYKLWNLDAWKVRDYGPQLGFKKIIGINVPFNKSGPGISSTPFTLMLMEMGRNDSEQDRMIRSIYEVQAARYRKTGKLTAAGIGRIDRSPWIAESTIVISGGKKEWQCVSKYAETPLPLFWASTATAYCWDALYNTAYTRKLVLELSPLHDKDKGFMAGKYDNGEVNKAITLETNGLILEAAMYK
ncbi:DUF3131 domain-containing protein [Maridesulfovibrio sp.]|uniref:DUF3131 domain-containing protein n=1 Tax=unclassified Maridesulfovibrio TaxID=2794999 RepID=UPI003B00A0A7